MGTLNYDIAILSEGIIANISALYLKEHGYKVALTKTNDIKKKWPKSAYVALNTNNIRLLNEIGIKVKNIQPFNTINVDMNEQQLTFKSESICYQNFGYIVQLAELDALTSKASKSIARIDIDKWQKFADFLLCCKSGHTANKEPVTILQHQLATALIHAPTWPKSEARQYFNKREVFGLLPTNQKDIFALIHSSKTSYSAPELLNRIQSIDSSITKLQHFQGYFPIKSYHHNHYYRNRTISCHNACHMIHPMAGFGLNMGLSDLRELAHCSLDRLSKYQHTRYIKNTQTISMINKIYHLYCDPGYDSTMIDICIKSINDIEFIKSFFMHQAQSV